MFPVNSPRVSSNTATWCYEVELDSRSSSGEIEFGEFNAFLMERLIGSFVHSTRIFQALLGSEFDTAHSSEVSLFLSLSLSATGSLTFIYISIFVLCFHLFFIITVLIISVRCFSFAFLYLF